MKKIIIIPTYNEFKNVGIICKKIRKYIKSIEILFIDDNSPDGTLKVIKDIMKTDKKIKYLTRKKKEGIGSAHKYGIKWALRNNYNLCITMDSDLTHDPKIIPKMLEYSKNYDLVQTNRFLDKNSMKTWPFYRRVLTSIRYILLYFLLGIKHESSGAFRCYNFKRMNPDLIFYAKNNSYSFFWETIFIFTKENCKIKDLKIILPYRTMGTSKLKLRDWFHGLYYLFEVFIKDLFNMDYKKK
mgnify:FL=1